jgi:membrane protein
MRDSTRTRAERSRSPAVAATWTAREPSAGREAAGEPGREVITPWSIDAPSVSNESARICAGWIMRTLRHVSCPVGVVIDAKPSLTRLFRLPNALWSAVVSWVADGGPRLGATVAFYSLFALAPLLVVATAVAGAVFGLDEVRGQFIVQMSGLIGEDAAHSLGNMISSAWKPETGLMAGLLGIATLLAGATGVLVELRNALNTMLHLPNRKRSAIRAFLRARLAALALVLGFGFLLIISLMLSTLLATLGGWLPDRYPEFKVLLGILDAVISLAVLTAAFAAIVRWLPSEPPTWRLVGISAVASAVLFTLGKYLVGLYLARAAFVSAYGAAGSLAVILVWIYFTSQLMLLAVALARQFEIAPQRPAAQQHQPVPAA